MLWLEAGRPTPEDGRPKRDRAAAHDADPQAAAPLVSLKESGLAGQRRGTTAGQAGFDPDDSDRTDSETLSDQLVEVDTGRDDVAPHLVFFEGDFDVGVGRGDR